MSNDIVIYHGSKNIIEKPIFGEGKKTNDFGVGFYCTMDNELAKEWAVTSITNGFSNKYLINTEYLKILNLNSSEYTILNWIAILLKYRLFSITNPIAKKAKQYIIDNFSINVDAYDIIIGYRADDSYYDYAESFINNSISLNQLAKAMKLGKLGEQIVIKSKYAFSLLKYEVYEYVDLNEYFYKKEKRNYDANMEYMKILEEDNINDLYIRDIVNGGIKNDDPRIPRNISK